MQYQLLFCEIDLTLSEGGIILLLAIPNWVEYNYTNIYIYVWKGKIHGVSLVFFNPIGFSLYLVLIFLNG